MGAVDIFLFLVGAVVLLIVFVIHIYYMLLSEVKERKRDAKKFAELLDVITRTNNDTMRIVMERLLTNNKESLPLQEARLTNAAHKNNISP